MAKQVDEARLTKGLVSTQSTYFEYQLSLLQTELETIGSSIRQMDDITKNIKQWTITVWAAAVGGALVAPELKNYVAVTAVIPLLFWFVEAFYRRIQRRFIWRSERIGKFFEKAACATRSRTSPLMLFHCGIPLLCGLAIQITGGSLAFFTYCDFLA
jgi:hypothetical protein